MKELPKMVERIHEGAHIAAEYFLSDHGNRINAETADWCPQLNIDICAAVNTRHYRMEHDSYGARRDIRYLQQCGITLFQIDSQYDQHF